MKKVYSRIEAIAGNVITVNAGGVRYGELAVVSSAQRSSLAEVIRLYENKVSLQVFAGSRGISTGDQVRFLGHPMQVSFSANLLGRIFDGGGKPRDKGPELSENMIEIGGPSVNPAQRIIPRNMIRTGIPMIDMFNSLVVSQKLPVFSVSGEPYNPLLARIALQAEVDVIILGGMGLKYDDYLFFKDTLERGGALNRTVFFVHTASDPIVECLLVPDISLAVAEGFALQGKKVLVLLTDMTNFADALKEIAITMEQVPSNRGYPGDLYSQLAARYEKAVDFSGTGSITILGVTTMPGDDVTHPVPDNTGYITEGQYYLKNGRIEPFGSLSRLKQLVNKGTRPDHRALMDSMITLYAAYKESLEKKSMGFKMTEWDQKLLKYGVIFEQKMMDLSVNIPLETALDNGWQILASCFSPEETRLRSDLVKKFWPAKLPAPTDMPAVKLTKTELKRQKDALKRYRRYLPTLILKKQQLQMVIRQLEHRLAEETRNREGLIAGSASWLDLFAEPFPFHDWLKVKSVQTESGNIAGVEIPVFKSMDFITTGHDLFMTPPWVDEALSLFARLSRLDVEIGLSRRQSSLLEAELRVTSQRVNLFEKVKIPQAIESIRKIHIYLGDQQTAAVVRGKIAKKNLLRRAEAS